MKKLLLIAALVALTSPAFAQVQKLNPSAMQVTPTGGTADTLGDILGSPVKKLRAAMARAKASNLLINGLYAGAATVTQAAAVDETTMQSIDPYAQSGRLLYKNGKLTGSANSVQTYSIQNLSGATLRDCAIEFMTDSATITIKGRRQSSGGFRIAINDQYVDASTVTAWSTADATYNYLVIAGLTGINKIRFEYSNNFVSENIYVTALASVWAPPTSLVAAVIGDSFTAGSGATNPLDSFVHKLGILTGVDVIFPLGYSGGGYVASLTGTTFTGTTTAGSTTVLVANTTGLSAGKPIKANGTGSESPYIARHTKIVSVVTNTSITLDTPAIASGTDVSLFASTSAPNPLDYYNRSTGLRWMEFDFQRMPRYPDVIFFMLGLNDDGNATDYAGNPAYAAKVRETLQLARKLCPNALIVNFGVPSPSGNGNSGAPNYYSTYSRNNENTIKAAVTALNDPLIINVSNSTDDNAGVGGSWFWGDGKVGTTTGHGNTDIYITSDGTHPNTAGHLFLAQKMVNGLDTQLSTLVGY